MRLTLTNAQAILARMELHAVTKLEVTCATADQDGLVKDVKMR